MKIKRFLSILVSSALVFGNIAFAEHTLKSDPVGETIIVEGSIDKSVSAKTAAVSVNILKLGKTISELEEITQKIIDGTATTESLTDVLAYSAQVPVNSDRTFKIVAPINGDSGLYTVYVDYEGNTSKKGVEFGFVKLADNIVAVGKLLGATSAQEAIQKMNEEWIMLDFENEVYSSLNSDEVAKAYYGLVQEEGFEKEEVDVAETYFDRACALQALEEGKGDVEETLELLGIDEKDDLYLYAATKNLKASIAIEENLEDKDCVNLEEYETALTEAVVRAFVLYPDGTGDVRDVITDFADEIGIKSPTTNLDVYAKLAGKSYDSFADVKKAYDDAVEEVNEKKNDSSDKGNRGPSSSGSFSTVGVPGIEVDPTPVGGQIDNEAKAFDDLDEAAWAKDAITALHQKGIVSGKGEKKFAPNDSLTREQFVTMLVNAFGLTETEEQVSFEDVNSSDWFAKYVKIAVQNGVASGMGAEFGIGLEITRQDMAVMVMNTVNKLGLGLATSDEDVQFADDAEISDYAKDSVKTLKAAGIINGMGDGNFNPKGVNTRAQAAVVIYSVLNAIGK